MPSYMDVRSRHNIGDIALFSFKDNFFSIAIQLITNSKWSHVGMVLNTIAKILFSFENLLHFLISKMLKHLISDCHKKNQKLQWTREGAHNILQLRAAMASNEWVYIWQETILSALGIAA